MQPSLKYRALVVDDEVSLVHLQTSFLSDIGIEGVGVYSGIEAIHYLQSHQVDLIISDVRMPGAVDGVKLYDWISQNRTEMLNRFLFVSGDMIGMNAGDFFLTSTVPRIQKPFLWDDYSLLVQQLLGNEA
ncbi:MAG TPA: response regulator [Pyrinomonadaceae bacterium]|nr:response regulator [Pyrinomonadaceae bacterium]